MIWFIAGVSVFALILISVGLIRGENRRFRVTEYSLVSEKVKKPVTLAVISDLHNYSYGKGNCRLLEVIDEAKPDLVISSGDMIEACTCDRGTCETVSFLKELDRRYDFVYGCGNHEWKVMHEPERYSAVAKAFADRPRVYDNENYDRPDLGIKVFGLNLEYDFYNKLITRKTDASHISQLVGQPDKTRFNILIGHNPDQFDAYADWGADLILSGHIHGGMIALPGGRGIISPNFCLFPKYYAGVYHKGRSDMIVSRGIGNHSVHIRIFNRAELLVIRILPK